VYVLLWRLLPGQLWLRIIIAVVLVGAFLTFLLVVVFPLADSLTIDSGNGVVGGQP
jgi:hypothetical protein